jgi:hypothetical protein
MESEGRSSSAQPVKVRGAQTPDFKRRPRRCKTEFVEERLAELVLML